MSKKKSLWARPIKTTIALTTISLAVLMGGILSNAPAVEAKDGFRLCYINTSAKGAMYFTRSNLGASPLNCSSFYVTYPDGEDRRNAKDVPTLNGVDYSMCENFTEWKFTDLPTDADICSFDFMKFETNHPENVYSIEELAELTNYKLK